MLFVGGSRAHHYQELFREIGIETIAAGYEFAHRDDYEGRRVLPGLKVDADSRNIEELHVEADADRFRPRLDAAGIARLEQEGIKLSDYEGMMAEMKSGALVIDDISQFETERLIEIYQQVALPLLPEAGLWARWTPRELARHSGARSGRRP